MKYKLSGKNVRFLLFLLVVHLVFFAIAVTYKRIYNGDSFEYIYMALNIKEKLWFYAGNPAMPVAEEYLTLRPPLYSLFLMLVYFISVNNWIVIVLQNVISIFNIIYLRHTVRKIGYKRRYDYILMAFVMLYPSQFVNANTIAPDILLQTAVLVYFHYFVMLLKQKRLRNAYWMSLALIAGFLVKPVLYPFVVVHSLIVLAVAARFYKGLLRGAFASVLPLCAALIFIGWNGYRTGKAHFSSTQSFNAVYYYYFYFSDKEGLDKAEAFIQNERAHMAAIPDFAERYDYANKRGMQLLKDNFGPYMLYHIKHSARLLIDPGKGEWDMFTGNLSLGRLYEKKQTGFYASIRNGGFQGFEEYVSRNPSFALVMIVLLFNIIRLAGFLLFIFNRGIDWRLRLFVLCLVGYFAMTTGPIANPRYFIPVSLITMGCATIGFQRLLPRPKNKAIIVRENVSSSLA